ncbi:hypothetical protein Goshw_002437 [Gossypium schwendimanii]|uniref:Uncharacterized protein n=1 Tax=Gossypium schwendimanii TaxID=34291 RepID=A0A7J9MLU5_GOSSC|nr:hypothetical protein [Gossypium schwendimanii]
MNLHLSSALLTIFLALSALSSSSHATENWSRSMFWSKLQARDRRLSSDQICHGHSGKCLEETDLDIHRRELSARKYISYAALRMNAVPCNRPGRSYYNCGIGQVANPYTRGCSVLTRCRRFTA